MVQIAPTAEIVGPVLLEDGVVIGDRARIIGPTWLGQKVRVGESVTVRESALWEASEVAEGAWIQSSIVAKGEGVAPGESLVSRFRLGSDVEIAPGLQFLPEDRAVASNVRRGYEASKRVLDALLAGVGLLLLAPLFAVVALVIRLDSRGPVFYRELRCGRWGREFEVLKFRTMGIDASQEQLALRAASEVDGPMFKISVDPRVTRIGRFLRMSSIDELPQLVNVFRGEMSLVGPRPLKIEEMSWAPQWRDLRLTVLPGLTGLWQLRSRSSGSFDDWIKNDVGYVLGPPTLAGDLRILFETVVAWLTGRSRGS
jgi:lipopolysaccharide/colanic/teichoic acid biosynthesis glycosyltransferase